MLEGIIFEPSSVADIDLAFQDAASEEVSLLMQAVEELKETVEEVGSNMYFRPYLVFSCKLSMYPCAHSNSQQMLQLTYENKKLKRDLEVAQDIAAQAQHAAAARRVSSFLDFVPAALLRPFGFVPD